MPQKISCGLLMYRLKNGLELFLVHPGGPFFKNKDYGTWTIPKGEVNQGEKLIDTARREFGEETGIVAPDTNYIALGSVRLKSGKIIHGWAFEGDWSGLLRSNQFSMEWPLKSGKMKSFPEADKAMFFSVEVAKKKIHPAQASFIDSLVESLNSS